MSTKPFNLSLVAKLLNRAGHPQTDANEALIAVRKAGAHFGQLNFGLLGDALIDIVEEASSAPDPYAGFHAEVVKRATKLETRNRRLTTDLNKLRTKCETQRREHAAEIADLREASDAKDAEIAELKAANAALLAAIATKNAQLAERPAEIESLRAELAKAQQDVARAEASNATQMKTEAHEDVTSRGDIEGSDRVGADVDESDHVGKPSRKMRWTRRAKARLAAYVAAGISKARIARLIACEFLVAVSAADISAMMRTRWLPDADGYLWAA